MYKSIIVKPEIKYARWYTEYHMYSTSPNPDVNGFLGYRFSQVVCPGGDLVGHTDNFTRAKVGPFTAIQQGSSGFQRIGRKVHVTSVTFSFRHVIPGWAEVQAPLQCGPVNSGLTWAPYNPMYNGVSNTVYPIPDFNVDFPSGAGFTPWYGTSVLPRTSSLYQNETQWNDQRDLVARSSRSAYFRVWFVLNKSLACDLAYGQDDLYAPKSEQLFDGNLFDSALIRPEQMQNHKILKIMDFLAVRDNHGNCNHWFLDPAQKVNVTGGHTTGTPTGIRPLPDADGDTFVEAYVNRSCSWIGATDIHQTVTLKFNRDVMFATRTDESLAGACPISNNLQVFVAQTLDVHDSPNFLRTLPMNEWASLNTSTPETIKTYPQFPSGDGSYKMTYGARTLGGPVSYVDARTAYYDV